MDLSCWDNFFFSLSFCFVTIFIFRIMIHGKNADGKRVMKCIFLWADKATWSSESEAAFNWHDYINSCTRNMKCRYCVNVDSLYLLSSNPKLSFSNLIKLDQLFTTDKYTIYIYPSINSIILSHKNQSTENRTRQTVVCSPLY